MNRSHLPLKSIRVIYVILSLCCIRTLQAQTPTVGDIEKKLTLEEVVVTGTGTEHPLKDAPVQTEVISGKTLKNFAGKSMEDILGMLTASFDFNEGDMGSQMQMNGLGNSYILILINGKRIHGDVGGENDLALIDPNNIERIEIVKGASSALYGSDAIAGVLNIITKKHYQQGIQLENKTRAGSYGDLRQHNSIAYHRGKWSSYTNFQLQHTDGWQNTTVEAPALTEFLITDSRNKTVNRYTNWQLAEQLTFEPSKHLQFHAQATIYRKRIYRPSGKYPSTDVNTYDFVYQNASAAVGAKWKINQTDQLTLDLDWNRHAYYYHFTDTTLTDGYINGRFTNYYPYFPSQQQLQSDQRRAMAHLKGVFQLPHHQRLSAGVEWRYDWLKAPLRVEGGKATDNTAALYLQDEWNPLHRLNLTAGLRLNRNQQFGFRLTPKISAMLRLREAWRLRATWSQGFKTPTPKELHYCYVRQMSGTYLYLGNKQLTPQRSNYLSAGVEYTHNHLSIALTAYHNRVDRMITLVTIPNYQAPEELYVQYQPIKTRQYQNIDDAKTYGIDLSLRYTHREFAFALNYSYLDTHANTYDTTHERMKHITIDGTAHHKANAYATWSHSFTPAYRLGVGIYGKMSSKRYYQINGNGKAYQIWKLATIHEFATKPHLAYAIEAGIDNIFNHVDRTDHGLHLGTTTPGTTLYASFAIRFTHGEQRNHKTTIPRNNDDTD